MRPHRTAGGGLAVAGLAAVGPCPSGFALQRARKAADLFMGGVVVGSRVLLPSSVVAVAAPWGHGFGGDFRGPRSLTPRCFRNLALDPSGGGGCQHVGIFVLQEPHPLALPVLFNDSSLETNQG
jgi:hypothetical protein